MLVLSYGKLKVAATAKITVDEGEAKHQQQLNVVDESLVLQKPALK